MLLLIGGIMQLIMSVTVLGLMIALLNEISKGDCRDGQCDEGRQIVVLVFGVPIAFFLIAGAPTDVHAYAR